MEKIYDLMGLVNDYEQLKGRIGKFEFIFDSYFMSRHDEKIEYIKIISKSYGFIERLVKQNKIDDSKVGNSDMLSVQYHDLVNEYKYEGLIMILSISENPISDLCSFLK